MRCVASRCSASCWSTSSRFFAAGRTRSDTSRPDAGFGRPGRVFLCRYLRRRQVHAAVRHVVRCGLQPAVRQAQDTLRRSAAACIGAASSSCWHSACCTDRCCTSAISRRPTRSPASFCCAMPTRMRRAWSAQRRFWWFVAAGWLLFAIVPLSGTPDDRARARRADRDSIRDDGNARLYCAVAAARGAVRVAAAGQSARTAAGYRADADRSSGPSGRLAAGSDGAGMASGPPNRHRHRPAGGTGLRHMVGAQCRPE